MKQCPDCGSRDRDVRELVRFAAGHGLCSHPWHRGDAFVEPELVYLVVLNDEPREIWSAWSTREMAQTEIDTILKRLQTKADPHDYYWHQNRLAIESVPFNQSR